MDESKLSIKEAILLLIKTLLKVNIGEEIFKYKEFQEFLKSERIFYLKISYIPSTNQILLITNETPKEITDKDLSITFYKITKTSIAFDTFFENINITFTQNSFSSLLKNEIDANILLQLKQKKNQTAVESYVENFKERIDSIEKKLKEDKILSSQITEENFSLISSPEEEIDFWKILSLANPQDIRINSIY